MIDITPIIEAVIGLAAALITVFLIPYIKSKTTAEQREDLKDWIELAVKAAEKRYEGAGRGDEKRDFVLEWLEKHNFTVDDETLRLVMEAFVKDLDSEANKTEVSSNGI